MNADETGLEFEVIDVFCLRCILGVIQRLISVFIFDDFADAVTDRIRTRPSVRPIGASLFTAWHCGTVKIKKKK